MMKKLTILVMIATLIAFSAAQAQDYFEKGLIEIGGNIGFSSSGGDLYKNAAGDGQSSFSFAPMGAYFLMDNLSLGGTVSYSSSSQGDNSTSNLGIGPRVEYYWPEQMGPGFVYGSLSYTINSGTVKFTGGSTDMSGSSLRIAPGYFYAVNDKVGLTAELYFSMDSQDAGSGSASGSVFGLTIGFKMFK